MGNPVQEAIFNLLHSTQWIPGSWEVSKVRFVILSQRLVLRDDFLVGMNFSFSDNELFCGEIDSRCQSMVVRDLR